MKTNTHRFLGVTLVFAVVFVALGTTAEAIPPFARKYQTSCTTCHLAIQQRNAFGEAFRRNGYKMPEGEDELVKREKVSLGAPAWKEEWPKAVWPSDIPFTVPFGAYIHQRLVYDPSKDDNFSFDAPHEFELLTGGSFGKDISFYGSWVFFEKDKNAVGLKQMYIQFEDLAGPENALNVKMGRMEPAITWGYRDSNRMTLEHNPLWDIRVLTQGSKWRIRDQQSGVEVNGIFKHRFEYAVGVVNGDSRTTIFKPLDTYWRLGYKFGGMGLDGLGGQFNELQQINNWRDDSFTLGVFGYSGTNSWELFTDEGVPYENDFDRLGVDLQWGHKRLLLRGGFVDGTDDNPDGDGVEVDSDGWFGEADYVFRPWLYGVARYGETTVREVGKEIVTLALVGLVRANIRLSIEALVEPGRDTDELRWIKINFLYGL